MRRVSWACENGRTVTFDSAYDAGPFFFKALTSELGATAEVSRAPRQDGQTTHYTALDARTINLTGFLQAFGDRRTPALSVYDRLRSELHQAFAPNRWGILTYYKEDQAVRVRCRPLATPAIDPPTVTMSAVDISFTADSPYWETAAEYTVSVGTIQRFRHFPWAPVLSPMGAFNRYGVIDNPSAELIYPSVEVFSTARHITVANVETGAFITIEHAIAPDQKLVVDLRDVSAFLWEQTPSGDYALKEDVSHWMSLDSEPWGLRPGRNRVVITNEVPEDTPLAFIKYRIPSLGV